MTGYFQQNLQFIAACSDFIRALSWLYMGKRFIYVQILSYQQIAKRFRE